jgi:hypothetical protein
MHIATGGIVNSVLVREWPKGRDNQNAYTGHTIIIGLVTMHTSVGLSQGE